MRPLKSDGLVCGGAVEAWNRQFEKSEIDTELGTVVNQVIEKHGSVEEHAWAIDEDTVSEGQLPMGCQVSVSSHFKLLASFGGRAIKFSEQVSGGLEGKVREFLLSHVHAGSGENHGTEFGEAGGVEREAADGHGFLVGLPLGIAFGNSLEGAAGVLNFSVVVEKQDF
jgi:hypothetical protein